jgi:hypothetical protein
VEKEIEKVTNDELILSLFNEKSLGGDTRFCNPSITDVDIFCEAALNFDNHC